MESIRTIGILLFDDIELLDFAGPLQVFSSVQSLYPNLIDRVETVGLTSSINVSKSNIKIECNQILTADTTYDLVIIPGGMGTRTLLKDDVSLKRINTFCRHANFITSVCTGSLILAQLGFLKHFSATTHHKAYDLLTQLEPTVVVDKEKRYIDHGKIIMAQGVSAGIDMSLYLLEKYYGSYYKTTVRDYIEYHPEIQNY